VSETTQLRELISDFLSGTDRSKDAAGRIEVALEEEFGETEPFASAVLALASYEPGGGEFLYDEREIVLVLQDVLRALGVDRQNENNSSGQRRG